MSTSVSGACGTGVCDALRRENESLKQQLEKAQARADEAENQLAAVRKFFRDLVGA
jgi:Arc/MetJ family transcription regulator